jgi:uncharacterized Zn finger protein (UPF0148 family)
MSIEILEGALCPHCLRPMVRWGKVIFCPRCQRHDSTFKRYRRTPPKNLQGGL